MPNLPSKNLEKSSVAFKLLSVVILLKRVIGIHSPPSLSRPVAWDKPLVSFWKSCQFLLEIQPIRNAKWINFFFVFVKNLKFQNVLSCISTFISFLKIQNNFFYFIRLARQLYFSLLPLSNTLDSTHFCFFFFRIISIW